MLGHNYRVRGSLREWNSRKLVPLPFPEQSNDRRFITSHYGTEPGTFWELGWFPNFRTAHNLDVGTDNLLFNKTNGRTNFPNLFFQETLHILARFDDSFQARSSWPCLKAVIKPAWHISVQNVQWKTPDGGKRNCRKHVEFLDKNKFGKLVRLLVSLKRKLVTMHGHMNVKLGTDNTLCQYEQHIPTL
jgi:ribosomal protein L27